MTNVFAADAAGGGLTPVPAPLPGTPGAPPSSLEVWGAAFGLHSTIVNAVDFMSRPVFKPDPSYSPQSVIAGTKFESLYGDRFTGDRSEAETRWRMARIEEEERQRAVLAAGGWEGVFAGMAAGILDPTTLVPVGGWLGAASRAGRVLIRAGEGAAVTGLTVAAQEGVLQTTQETRPIVESVFAIAGGALVGGVLGSAAGFLTRAQMDDLSRRLVDLPATRQEEADLFNRGLSGVGAASVAEGRGSGEAAGSLGAGRATAFQGPMPRLINSPNPESRNVIRDLAENPNQLAENADGIATSVGGSVESQAKIWNGVLAEDVVRPRRRLYSQYVYGKQTFAAPLRGSFNSRFRGSGKLSYGEFKEAISEAALNGDRHAIPEVAEAAVMRRAALVDKLRDEAIAVRVPGFADEVAAGSADESYLTRIWNTAVVRARRNDLVDILARHFESNQSATLRRIDALGKKVEEKRFEIDLTRRNVEDELDRFRSRAAELKATRTASGREAGAAGKELRGKAGALLREERAADRARRAQYRDLLADLKRGRPSTRYSDINSFVRSKGGMRLVRSDATGRAKFATAFGAEIQQVIGKGSGRGIVRRDGLDPDAMLRLAIDEGYLRPDADLNDLVSAIDDTLKGNPVFSQFDDEAVQRAGQIREMIRDLEQAGVDVAALTPNDLAKIMGDTSRPITPAMVSLFKEIEEVAARFDDATIRVSDIDRLADELKDMAPDLVEAARAGREAAKIAGSELRALERQISDAQRFADLTPDEIRAAANETIDNILGHSPQRVLLPADVGSGPRGPLKERMLKSLPTMLVRDFVERDVDVIDRIYTRTMATDIALMRKFGSVDLKDQIAKINDAANRAGEGQSAAEVNRIQKRKEADIRDVTAVVARLRGTYAIPTNTEGLVYRAARLVRDLNYMRLLGGMTLSAVPDLARPVMVHGLTRTLRTAFAPFTSSMATIRLAAREARLAGAGTDMILDDRMMSTLDRSEDFARGTAIERGLSTATQGFGIVSLMAPWNAVIRQFTGIVTQTRMLQAIERVAVGKASQKEAAYLAAGGIDTNMADRIGRQFTDNGVKDGDVWWANTSEWTDGEATRAFRAFMIRDVDRTILVPGQEKPLWMSTELGKVIGQFKSFSMASTQRVLVSGLEQRDMAALNGAILMMALGALSAKLKMEAGGYDTSNWTPTKWAVEGFDRSGLAGWFMDANNLLEKTALRPITAAGLTGETASRYQSRNVFGAVFGPTADLVGDVLPLGMTGEWSAADTHVARKLVPLQNVFWMRSGFDAIERGFNEAFGIPARRPSQ